MSIRERLFGITELNISQRLLQMKDNQVDEYVRDLNTFTERFPEQEEELKTALKSMDYLAFSRRLVSIRDMLTGIYADELAEECQKQINGLVSVKHERAEAQMTYLLSLISMLSIDVQMAVFKDEQDEEESRPADTADDQEKGKKSILAVDDNAFFLDTLKNALRDAEYRFTGVKSGDAALKYLQHNSPDLFILDIEMPEMDGYELAQKIKERGQAAPILFLTGNATKEYVLRALNAGAADFIVKPVTQNQVLERIGKFI